MQNLKKALLNYYRKYMTDPASRGTEQTDTFDGDGSTTDFTLTQKPLMYIDSVSVGGTSQILLRDFNLDFGTSTTAGKVKFITAPGTGSGNISVTYKYGVNWIYPGSPDVKGQLPRIGFRQVGGGEKSGGVGDKTVFLNPVFLVELWVRAGKSYTISGEDYAGDKLMDFIATDFQNTTRTIRDADLPYKTITMRVEDTGTDLPYDQKFNLYRRNLRLYVWHQKDY